MASQDDVPIVDSANAAASKTSRSSFFSRHFRPHFTAIARRSTAVRALTVIVLSLPPILYVVTFALTISTIQSPDFAAAGRLATGNPGDPQTGQPINKTQHASPWFTCTPDAGNGTDPFYFTESCVTRPALGQAGLSACQNAMVGDAANHLCEGIVTTAELYTAAAVMSFLAFVAASFYSLMTVARMGAGPRYHVIGATRGRGHDHHRSSAAITGEEDEVVAEEDDAEPPLPSAALNNALGAFATLLALATGACLLLGQLQGYSSMVVERSDVEMELGLSLTRWYSSTGLKQFTGAAYALSFIGAYIAWSRLGLHE